MCTESLDAKFKKVTDYFWGSKKPEELAQYYAKYPISISECELRKIGRTLGDLIGQEKLGLTDFTSGTINEKVELSDNTTAQVRGCFMEIKKGEHKIKIYTNLFDASPEHCGQYQGVIVEISNKLSNHKAILQKLDTYLNTWPSANIAKNKQIQTSTK
jgi:hypothetical protein